MGNLSDLLTIVIPVKNEEKNLPACLENVKDFTSVLLVDSGSVDKTREIFEGKREEGRGKRDGWEIVDFKWDGKFPKKRNWVLRNYSFKTPWVMFLDADELLTDEWLQECEAKLRGDCPEDVLICYYDTWYRGRMLRHGDIAHKTALVRFGHGEYERIEEDHWSNLDMEIHEHIQTRGSVGEIRAHLEHRDKRSAESHWKKHQSYADWEAHRYRMLNGDFSALTFRQQMKYRHILNPFFALGYFGICYFGKGGWMDGLPGLIFWWNKYRYFSLVRRKILKLKT